MVLLEWAEPLMRLEALRKESRHGPRMEGVTAWAKNADPWM